MSQFGGLPGIIGGLTAGATALGDQFAMWGANAQNEQRYNETLGLNASQWQWGHEQLDRNAGLMNAGYGALANNANNFFFGQPGPGIGIGPSGNPNQQGRGPAVVNRGDWRGAQQAGGGQPGSGGGMGGGIIGQVNQGYGDLRNRALADYEGYGRQGRKDINQQFDTLGSQARGDATRRGLASSTVMGGLNRGVARERADALGRHDERIQMGRIGLDTSLTGQQLANQWNTGLTGYNAQNQAYQQQLGAMDAGNMRTFDFGNQNLTNRQNIISGRNDVYQPTPLGAYSQLGAGMAPAPNYPTDNSGLIGGGFGLANTGILAAAFG